ncbi:MAG: hypothetical protein Q9179_001085 [Wetmoreana sp. 5 TL-2023]
MSQITRIDSTEKALPMTPNQVIVAPIVTASFTDSTDLENLPTPNVTEAPQSARPSQTKQTRQSILSFPQRISQIVGPEQSNKPNGSTDEVQFPAIALFQNSNWTSQATLRPKSQKCFLGWLKEDAVFCDDLPSEQLIPGQSCNCKAGWTNDVIEGFEWQNTTYRYVSWRPTPKLIDRVPTYLMTLQAFFTYNTSQSLADSSATQSPSLWLAIYDPQLNLTDALEKGYTRMVLIAANGDNAINLGLTYRQAPNYPPAYDYDVSLSSNQNLDIVCDTSPGKYIQPCFVTLFIQIPTFDRRVIMQRPVMRWGVRF